MSRRYSTGQKRTRVLKTEPWTKGDTCRRPGRGGRRPRQDRDRDQDGPKVVDLSDAETTAAVGLLISDNCENLIQEFLRYKEEDIGGSNARDHCLDALRYIIHTNESSAGNDDNRRDRPDHHGVRMLG